ncbi:MAG: redox-sensing transcriptional repressor Rex [Ruminococcaceae bacterium]|nr:redox-sensing transcriptional repressor Rex [Oscillospiraceae bacterium]
MSRSNDISLAVIRRLPRYYRFLDELLKKGVVRVSSGELSAILGLTASQIRQDLNCFGGFGQQGYGYLVEQLHDEIGKILGLDRIADAILIGAGNLGRAIANHLDFEQRGFHLTAIFDAAQDVIGQRVGDLTVSDMATLEEFCRLHKPSLAILCVPYDAAKANVDRLKNSGIHVFWNFSHYDIGVDDPGCIVENVHLGDSLMTLSYRMKNA